MELIRALHSLFRLNLGLCSIQQTTWLIAKYLIIILRLWRSIDRSRGNVCDEDCINAENYWSVRICHFNQTQRLSLLRSIYLNVGAEGLDFQIHQQ